MSNERNRLEPRPEEHQRVQLEEGEYAPFTYFQCGKLAMRHTWEAKKKKQEGILKVIELTEENKTVITTSKVGMMEHGSLIFFGKEVELREVLSMDNEEHRNVLDSNGAIFIPSEIGEE